MVEGAKLHLKEWLIAQIDGAAFDGLCWEDDAKTMFRIPWKHAAKKDYNQMEDAALFKAWAEYKGKYKEGRDKADPTMWKTRLRCALNKSTDFQEVPERNQLDISEPYKVYRIQPDNGSARPVDHVINQEKSSPKRHVCVNKQPCFNNESSQVNKEEKTWTAELMKEHMYCELTQRKKQNQVPASIALLQPGLNVSDVRMQVTLLYQGQKVMEMTTTSPDGCFILQGHVPVGNERIYGPCTAQQLTFPSPNSVYLPPRMSEAMNCLLCHLERGVLLWVAQDGVFIKRFCQGRVYWSGPMAQHADRPNKLEREKTFKLVDIPKFISELQNCLQGKGTKPSYIVELCFGEEYPDPNIPKSRKLIIAQVVPLFAVELLQKFNLGETEEKQSSLGSDAVGEKVSERCEKAALHQGNHEQFTDSEAL